MSSRPLDAGLSRRIDELGARDGTPVSWLQVRDAVESILTTTAGDPPGEDVKLFAEVEALARFIQSAKAEIAALRPDRIQPDHIVAATDELDAVVNATEDATNTIMEAAETIEGLGANLDDGAADALSVETTKIFEACGFQDITGQRIGKVVAALKEIEIRVDAIVATFHDDGEGFVPNDHVPADPATRADAETADESALLHGPQHPDQANNQDDIDALFNGKD